jgi:type I restriction enzyme M protein
VEAGDAAVDADLAYLRELELVSFSGAISGGEYRLAIPMMADWIAQHQDADLVAGRARTEAEEEDA